MQKIIKFLPSLTAAFIVAVLAGCTAQGSEIVLEEQAASVITEEDAAFDTSVDAAAFIESREPGVVVYICGAVNAPDVYELDAGARVRDAVEAAGGFSEDADRTYVNLAAPVQDGIKLVIPTKEETALAEKTQIPDYDVYGSDPPDAAGEGNGLVNINTATLEQLKTLPGIGDSIASRIIDDRSSNGRFSKPEDIMRVSGIKEKLFSKIKDKITTG